MPDYRGMTINERLSKAGLFDRWDQAVRDADRRAMVSLLESVDMTSHEAVWTADEVLRRRVFDAQRKSLDGMSLADLGRVYAGLFGRPGDLAIGAANLKELILTELRLANPPATQ